MITEKQILMLQFLAKHAECAITFGEECISVAREGSSYLASNSTDGYNCMKWHLQSFAKMKRYRESR
jgi:hypothetical protein